MAVVVAVIAGRPDLDRYATSLLILGQVMAVAVSVRKSFRFRFPPLALGTVGVVGSLPKMMLTGYAALDQWRWCMNVPKRSCMVSRTFASTIKHTRNTRDISITGTADCTMAKQKSKRGVWSKHSQHRAGWTGHSPYTPYSHTYYTRIQEGRQGENRGTRAVDPESGFR